MPGEAVGIRGRPFACARRRVRAWWMRATSARPDWLARSLLRAASPSPTAARALSLPRSATGTGDCRRIMPLLYEAAIGRVFLSGKLGSASWYVATKHFCCRNSHHNAPNDPNDLPRNALSLFPVAFRLAGACRWSAPGDLRARAILARARPACRAFPWAIPELVLLEKPSCRDGSIALIPPRCLIALATGARKPRARRAILGSPAVMWSGRGPFVSRPPIVCGLVSAALVPRDADHMIGFAPRPMNGSGLPWAVGSR